MAQFRFHLEDGYALNLDRVHYVRIDLDSD